jgi:Helicase conserved C-terminal domain
MLISLKAGGVGLNLTAADTVIHHDPWWNPAAENQATDRAHRIGQDKPVFVYKLIVAGSIKEKIVTMQQHKAELADAILSKDGAGEVKSRPTTYRPCSNPCRPWPRRMLSQTLTRYTWHRTQRCEVAVRKQNIKDADGSKIA